MTALPDAPRSAESDVDVLADLLFSPPVPGAPTFRPVPSDSGLRLEPSPAGGLPDAPAGRRGRERDVSARVRLAARVRGTALRGGTLLVVAGLATRLAPVDTPSVVPLVAGAASALGLVLLLLAILLCTASPAADVHPEPLSLPLDGYWDQLHQVAGTAGGHGTHGYGQAFALDLAHHPAAEEDADPAARGLLSRLGLRRPQEFASFDQPVFAVGDATVVRVVDGVRDHRSRSSLPARAAAAVGGAVRELCGARAVLGNHIVLDLGHGRYALCAHLRRHSALVEVGDRVLPGEEIGAVGCSGGAAQPHLHVQVMDSPRPLTAAGLPFTLVEG